MCLMSVRAGTVLLVAFLAFDLVVIVGLAHYTTDMTRCWNLADSGLSIWCGPHVPEWGWGLAIGIGVALCATLLWPRRATNAN